MQAISRKASVLRVPRGSASSPTAKFLYRLNAPCRWWNRSTGRIVVREIRSFPLRIQAYLREPFLRCAVPMPMPDPDLCDSGPVFGGARNTYVETCNEDMQTLLRKYRWATPLDQRMASEAYQRGANWGARNHRNESEH